LDGAVLYGAPLNPGKSFKHFEKLMYGAYDYILGAGLKVTMK